MTPERWQQVQTLFLAALERDRSQRVAFLDDACSGDVALRQELDSLLAMHESSGEVLDNTVGAQYEDCQIDLPEVGWIVVKLRIVHSEDVPLAKSWDSTNATENPRAAASSATPSPVAPPPMIATS